MIVLNASSSSGCVYLKLLKGFGERVYLSSPYVAVLLILLLSAIAVLSFALGKARTKAMPLDAADLPQPINPNPLNVTIPVDQRASDGADRAYLAHELFFGPTPDKPLITVSCLSSPTMGSTGRNVHPADFSAERLNAFAQAVPAILQGMNQHGSTWMRVVVNGPLESDGSGLFFPFVRDNQGQIAELARLDSGKMGMVANAAAFWQIASIIVAQKQLADISAKLSDIRSGIDKIIAFLESKRKAMVTGCLAYLQQLVECIRAGEIPMGALQMIEKIEIDILGVQEHILDDFRSWISDLESYEDRELMGSEQMFNKLRQSLSELEKLNEIWALSEKARILNTQILSGLPSSRAVVRTRLQSVRIQSEIFRGSDGIKDRAVHLMQKKINQIKSDFNRLETIEARRNEIRNGLDKVTQFHERLSKNLEEHLRKVEREIQAERAPIQLEARLERGRIVALRQVD